MVPCSVAVRNDPGQHGAYIWQSEKGRAITAWMPADHERQKRKKSEYRKNIERLNRDLLKGGLLL